MKIEKAVLAKFPSAFYFVSFMKIYAPEHEYNFFYNLQLIDYTVHCGMVFRKKAWSQHRNFRKEFRSIRSCSIFKFCNRILLKWLPLHKNLPTDVESGLLERFGVHLSISYTVAAPFNFQLVLPLQWKGLFLLLWQHHLGNEYCCHSNGNE